MVRSALAVIAGFATMTLVVVAFTFVAMSLLHPDLPVDAPVDPSGTWLAVNLAYSLLAAIVGGWVTGRIARHARLGHAVALALVVLATTIAGSLGGDVAVDGRPGWYAWAIGAIGIGGVLIGGSIAARGRAATGKESSTSPAS